MRLSDFLIENIKPIVQEWESFARTLPIAVCRPYCNSRGSPIARIIRRGSYLELSKRQTTGFFYHLG